MVAKFPQVQGARPSNIMRRVSHFDKFDKHNLLDIILYATLVYHVVYKILWWLCSQQIQINIGCMENTCMENIHTGELAHVLVSDLLVCRVSSLSKAFSQCISPG